MEKIKIGKRVLLSSDAAMLIVEFGKLFFLDMIRLCQVATLDWRLYLWGFQFIRFVDRKSTGESRNLTWFRTLLYANGALVI